MHFESTRRRGFTLVEMLVAISIVILLAALTITATQVLGERQQVNATETTMQLLDMAIQEYETAAGRSITWGVEDEPLNAVYDMLDESPHIYTMTEIMRTISDVPDAKTILARIDDDRVVSFDDDMPIYIRSVDTVDPDPNIANAQGMFASMNGERTVLDAWGIPIRAVHPGRVANAALFGDDLTIADDDGTIRLSLAHSSYGVEEIYGVVADRRILFVSAGPDRRFGSRAPGATAEQREYAEDNVYSYATEEFGS